LGEELLPIIYHEKLAELFYEVYILPRTRRMFKKFNVHTWFLDSNYLGQRIRFPSDETLQNAKRYHILFKGPLSRTELQALELLLNERPHTSIALSFAPQTREESLALIRILLKKFPSLYSLHVTWSYQLDENEAQDWANLIQSSDHLLEVFLNFKCSHEENALKILVCGVSLNRSILRLGAADIGEQELQLLKNNPVLAEIRLSNSPFVTQFNSCGEHSKRLMGRFSESFY
jgi:hypothetical protein